MGRTGILKLDIWMLMQAGVNWQIVRKEDTLSRRYPQKNDPRKKIEQRSSAKAVVTSGTQGPLSA